MDNGNEQTATKVRSVPIAQPTMFCSTRDCVHPAVVAVVVGDSKVMHLKCVDCKREVADESSQRSAVSSQQEKKKGISDDADDAVRGVRLPGQAVASREGSGEGT